jgi:hypothetical protein
MSSDGRLAPSGTARATVFANALINFLYLLRLTDHLGTSVALERTVMTVNTSMSLG